MKLASAIASSALCVAAAMCGAAISHAGPVPGQGTWETTLKPRDLDGNPATIEAYYDTALNITWLADGNFAAGSAFDNGVSPADGAMTWPNAMDWVAGLNIHGVTGWRLPAMQLHDPANFVCNFVNYFSGGDCAWNVDPATGEMAHLYFVTLGNLSEYDTLQQERPAGTWGMINTGPFVNAQTVVNPLTGEGAYWYGKVNGQVPVSPQWYFGTSNGSQYVTYYSREFWAWAVHDGDIGTPINPNDYDNDGVNNANDSCPGTAAGAAVDAKGCSVDQLCPCSGPKGFSTPWRNHGDYVNCVARTSESFLRDGLITDAQRTAIQSEAGSSQCGTPR